MPDPTPVPPPVLPCVVQVGFAGSRDLLGAAKESIGPPHLLLAEVEQYLVKTLSTLPVKLNLKTHHFLCGISQIAIGADTLFTRACRESQIPQRIFLPQNCAAYLTAIGSKGEPDFSTEERRIAETLLGSPHIIQERVVSDSPDRTEWFKDCNREILRVSDVILCLLRADAAGQPGGTSELLELAKSRGKPALEIRVTRKKVGALSVAEQWHGMQYFRPPTLPSAVAHLAAPAMPGGIGFPRVAEFCGVVKTHASREAKRLRNRFGQAALIIIGTHIVATLCATLALSSHRSHDMSIPQTQSQPLPVWTLALLGLELGLLVSGFGVHTWLHRKHPSKLWALARLLAEINRSVRALGGFHFYPAYLFQLRLPSELRPLLRTVNILHLQSTRSSRAVPWQTHCAEYVQNRLTNPDPKIGQIAYYNYRCRREERWLRISNLMFLACSSMAIVSTAAKFCVLSAEKHIPEGWSSSSAGILGTLAVFLP